MASLWKRDRSKYWYACFTSADGKQLKRSTKTTDRKKALKIAVELEAVAQSKKTKKQLWRVLTDLQAMFTDDGIKSKSVDSYADDWLASKKLVTAASTCAAYKKSVKKFMRHLGEGKGAPINELEKTDLSAFRDGLASSYGRKTANHDLKVVRMMLKDAKEDGYLPENPAEGVGGVKGKEENASKRAFTLPELERILKAANEEWRGMILFGLYTGQRLKDIAELTWSNVDLEENALVLTTSKTSRNQRIPLVAPLRNYLTELPSTDDPGAHLFPRAQKAVAAHSVQGTSTLSNQFYEILVSAGLAGKRSKKATGKGHGAKRKTNEISFHALRYTATSLLKKAGVPAAVVQDIVGHDSAAMSRHYTHVDDDSKTQALQKMPELG